MKRNSTSNKFLNIFEIILIEYINIFIDITFFISEVMEKHRKKSFSGSDTSSSSESESDSETGKQRQV